MWLLVSYYGLAMAEGGIRTAQQILKFKYRLLKANPCNRNLK